MSTDFGATAARRVASANDAQGFLPYTRVDEDWMADASKKRPVRRFLLNVWRRERDSNPRQGITLNTLSRRAT